MTEATAARRAALHILEDAGRGVPFDAARDRHLHLLADPDRRLAHELAAGVLRTQTRLDERLAPLVSARRWRRLPPSLQHILRLGAYQLESLDRVPPYAAVSTAVALARELHGAKSGGLVNAVLRRLAREAPIETAPPADGARRLATEHAHPEWLVRRWLEQLGTVETEALLRHNNTRPSVILQPVRWTVSDLLDALRAAGVTASRAPLDAGVVVPRSRPARLPGFAEGWWVVQDPAQALVLRFADVPTGALVYDACAAPGGKAVRLAIARRVVAGDHTRARLGRLMETLARTHSSVLPIMADARHPPVTAADVVLLDAPCTATGVLRRHPDARLRLSPAAPLRMARRQAALLDALAAVVRPGGLLVYVTCSLEPEENESQVTRFLKRHPEYHRAPSSARLPADLITPVGDFRLLPHRYATDGAFAARLRRVA